jgi:hypothetical protein
VPPATSGGSQRSGLRRRAAALLDEAWTEPGFCVPNRAVYPHQWLWDSCFHALVWAGLGSDRGLIELANALDRQADDGFVPHMTYWQDPDIDAGFWGRPGSSSITQPPMYGHALVEQARLGCRVPDDLVARARAGLAHLGARPRTAAGLVPVFHPWETGCDDSPRWDRWFPPGIGPEARRERKGELVAALVRSEDGHAIGSDRFAVGSIGFNALVAWNATELATGFGDPDRALTDLADELTEAIRGRWRDDRWVDDHGGDDHPSAAVRTVDSLLALLVDPRDSAFDQLADPEGFGAPFGPRGVHRAEPTYEPATYWRGSAWPQLTYLLMVAVERADRPGATRTLARWLVDGAERSGDAEHWNPETGAGLGARPQTWAALALLANRRR